MGDAEVFDLVVVGSGPGGEKGAAQAAYFGKKVALVERAPEVGGACVHTGTLPSKTLRETALYLTGFQRRELYGMSVRLDRKKSLRQLVGRLSQVIDLQTRQITRNLKRHGICPITGSASFEDARTVAVRDGDGRVIRKLSAGVFLIATGSSPTPPRGIEMRDPDVVDSDRILDLDRVPRKMTVVGGGVIGSEYACLFAALGTRITLVEGRDPLLGTETPTLPRARRCCYGFSPRPTPRLIATFSTRGPALAISKGLDRDRAVDESGNQLAVFGRRGSRPFDQSEMYWMYLRGDKVWTVTNDQPGEPLAFDPAQKAAGLPQIGSGSGSAGGGGLPPP